MLARAGLGDDPLLSEPAGEHDLAERVVDLVRAGVVQVLAFQVEALTGREPVGAGEGRGTPDVRPAEVVELGLECRVAPGGLPGLGELVERGDQGLRDVPPPVSPNVSVTSVILAPPRRTRGRGRGP